ncbi:hypothetical protein JANAI62_35270 [Jannaschia pagri]|uniref:Membrane protein implicated in regulation of membrane protease activity n=1 Tax=Jannaschia pagri TaxID=2829797 RepID=A0ABQ4NR66_9RHOB|nr:MULTISPECIES: OB-fold-containig protein [unclassified Jannaschia]GIT93069.1 hypothetical protein JANAI61_35270 [Jannaschia sp. AI_61]GIT96904.1 hypothetical protein JANAI62_35270 [Jannaschia sp. AI_62]
MITDLFSLDFAPFSVALVILFGLLALELVALVFGGSLVTDMDGPEIGLDIPDLELPEIEALDAGALDVASLEVPDVEATAPVPLGLTGLGRVPFLIWFVAALMGFGATGLLVQTLGPLPLVLAVPLAGAAGLGTARGLSGVFVRLLPQVETSVQSVRQLARRRGVVTQGTARRGRPTEIRVTDRFGNTHYIRAEPFRDEDHIKRGQTVLTIWDRRAGELRVVALD